MKPIQSGVNIDAGKILKNLAGQILGAVHIPAWFFYILAGAVGLLFFLFFIFVYFNFYRGGVST